MSSNETPRVSASTFAVSTTKAGSLRLPRNGKGARYGASVSTRMRSAGNSAAITRKAAEFLNVRMPVKETKQSERHGAAGEVGTAGKAMQHGREGALPGFLFENSRGILVGLARMNHERQAGFARRSDMGAEAALLRVARAALS